MVPPLHQYYEALRLLAVPFAALRCLRLAIPPCSEVFAPTRNRSVSHEPGVWSAVPRPLAFWWRLRTFPGSRGSLVDVPCSRTPARPQWRRSPRQQGVACCLRPKLTVSALASRFISGLSGTAHLLPVNASRPTSPLVSRITRFRLGTALGRTGLATCSDPSRSF